MKIQKKQEIEFFGTKTGNANSIALGYATETKNFGEVAVGVMNKSTAAKDPNSPKGVCSDSDATLFSVGCGGSGERKNALEVKGDGSVLISGENGDINVADKIKEALDTDASIELVKSTESDLQYTLMVNNESRGSINIPKDQFLKNVTYDTEAKQLVFTFVTLDEEEHVERISINDLKDVYTAGDGINIDNNVISADFSSVMTAISDEKTLRETTDNEIKSILDTKADASELKDVKKQVENKADLVDGKVPLAQLGNIDTQVMLVVDKLPNTDIKANKIYLVKNTDSTEDQNVYTEYVYVNWKWEKLGEFKPEVNISGYVTSDEIYQCIKKEYDPSKRGEYAIAIDDSAVATEYCSTALGHSAQANGSNTTAIGNSAQATNSLSTAIGDSAQATNGYSTALGCRSQATGDTSMALGCAAQAIGDVSTALGCRSQATGYTSMALGCDAQATGYTSIALGCAAQAGGENSTALGRDAQARGYCSTAIGGKAIGDVSTALGCRSQATGNASIALGTCAKTSTVSKYALGGFDENKRVEFNLEEITYSQYGNKKYLIGLGGYDGTNITTNNEAGEEILNPNIKSVQEIINSKAELVDGKLKAEQLPKLNNITAATTTEDMITKFNDLLADLKAKGYMTADITE